MNLELNWKSWYKQKIQVETRFAGFFRDHKKEIVHNLKKVLGACSLFIYCIYEPKLFVILFVRNATIAYCFFSIPCFFNYKLLLLYSFNSYVETLVLFCHFSYRDNFWCLMICIVSKCAPFVIFVDSQLFLGVPVSWRCPFTQIFIWHQKRHSNLAITY